MQNKNKELDRLNGVYMKLLNNAGVKYIEGRGTLVDAHTVEVAGKQYTVSRPEVSRVAAHMQYTGTKFQRYCLNVVEHRFALLCSLCPPELLCLDISLPCACSKTTVLSPTSTVWLRLHSIRKQTGPVIGADAMLS